MDISEVAKRSGVAASALRHYERKGLIRSLAPEGARRQYTPAVLDQLALIALGRAVGFSLDEIRGMFTPNGQPDINRQALASKADDIDRTVRGLMAMSQGLRHAAACPAPSHAECPSFQRLLKAAADGALGVSSSRLAPRQHANRRSMRTAAAAAQVQATTQTTQDPDTLFSVWQPATKSTPGAP
jgi:DNA-binding transcriptional MerR regulator